MVDILKLNNLEDDDDGEDDDNIDDIKTRLFKIERR